ncbi:Actin-like ATPase involved in cell division [Geitlerinema sp. FC II]|nr:Actin-like ATPase involved in cell division [Geitlerinema sp. FC II]
MAQAATNDTLIPCGYDGGNGNTKLVLPDTKTLIPSYFLPTNGEPHALPEIDGGAFVEYVSGAEKSLFGQTWFVGEWAAEMSPNGFIQVNASRGGKVANGLEMFLGAIACSNPPSQLSLGVAASIQDAETLGGKLSERLEGTHRIRVNKERLVSVKVSVLNVLNEGVGTCFDLRVKGRTQKGQKIALIDVGNGTTIASLVSGSKVVDYTALNVGVSDLIDRIARHRDIRAQLLQEGNPRLIRRGIERKSFFYGTTGYNFSRVYEEEVRPWLSESLSRAVKALDRWDDDIAHRFAVGGGSALPGVEKLLNKRNIASVGNPIWSNALGLYGVAEMKVREVQ